MPLNEMDSSRENERRLRHQNSGSIDFGKAMIPMWDSSDPDRAPPPLPLNPSSPSVASRPNTSTAIQSAHAALTERGREGPLAANSAVKRMETPERSLIKGAAHKRMQSLQTGHVRDLRNFIDGGGLSPTKSPERSPERTPQRPPSPDKKDDEESNDTARSPEKESSRSATPTSTATPRENFNVRPSLRRPQSSILSDSSSPQSATMLALQSMSKRESRDSRESKESRESRESGSPPPNATTNSSTAMVRVPQSFDAISDQILSLTSIATSLQREMAQLNRRSKDNATDLVSLKEATNARDEDIRKSLRDLSTNLTTPASQSPYMLRSSENYMLDDKPHTPQSRSVKSISLPRIPSPTSFSASLDRGLSGTPAPSSYNPDGSASIALLEKVLREMGTKEGQDLLVSRLTEVSNLLSHDGMETAKKMDEVLDLIKEGSGHRALVVNKSGGNNPSRPRDFSFEQPKSEVDYDGLRSGPMVSRVENLLSGGAKGNGKSRAADIVNEDVLKLIKSIKDSVAQGGGLTAEVKALVRELRGEVLGMGRDIGRKLEQARSDPSASSQDATASNEQVAQIINEGLLDLKQHLDHVMREARRQSSSSAISRSNVDGQEVYHAVRSALTDTQPAGVAKEDVIDAVREAWENYKPDIELQHFGLEREEMLTCLKEGIQEYMPHDTSREVGATREEVFVAVVEGLKHFTPPQVETEASLSRDEILDAVRECLEEFEFPSAPPPEPRDIDTIREDMLEAVTEGLSRFDFPVQTMEGNELSRDIGGDSLTKGDVYDAVKAGLEDMPQTSDAYGEQIHERLQEVLDAMHSEFRAVSDEAKQNVAAHGRDTEQVLDATKDGFEKLRIDIETYVDRAADVTGKDEIIDCIRENFDGLREELAHTMAQGSDVSMESVRHELNSFREAMATSVVPAGSNVDREEILSTLRDGLDGLRADMERPRDSGESILSGTGEILDALHDGLNSLRVEVERIGSKPVDMTVNYEILDTLKAGMEGLRLDIDRLRDSGLHDSHSSTGDRDIAAITSGAVIATEGLKRNDIENLEVLISQLGAKVESLENMPPQSSAPPADSVCREDIMHMEETLRHVQESVVEMSGRQPSQVGEESVHKEDFEAIETLLRNTKAKIDDLDPEQIVKKDHLDAVEDIIRETRDSISDILAQIPETAKREDVGIVEALVKDVMVMLQDVKDVSENDGNVGVIVLGVKDQIDQMISTDLAELASKEDVNSLGEIVKEMKDANNAAFDDRQAEIVGVGESVSEVKTLIEEFRDAIKSKVEEGTTGVDSISKLLEGLGPVISSNANITEDVKEVLETIKVEFEQSNAGVVGAKLESDEKFEKTWEKIDEKFEDLMLKYDDAQLAAESREKSGEESRAESDAALQDTKAIAEELKLLINTLGSTLTDSVDKMEEASKTVFNRVEDTYTKLEETHTEVRTENQLTRDQVMKTLCAVEDVHTNVNDYNPKILDSIKDVLLIVGQHYEHSKTSTDTIQEKIKERDVASLTSVQGLLQNTPSNKYDDGEVQEKLNKLVDHMHSAGKSFAQLDMLDEIHRKVMQTAAEVSEFVSVQTQRISNDHEDKVKEAEEAAITLEKRLAEQERVEADVARQRAEEQQLKDSVASLKAEQDGLFQQKMRLSADVSSLETALRIRREELHNMEARAEGLERRILEGVIDHSRAFLIGKTKGRDLMNLKRVPSHATSGTGSVANGVSSSRNRSAGTMHSAVGMAMNAPPRAVVSHPISNPAGASRRNFSLNQITNNVPTGGVKRSHSVKNSSGSGALRKTSWGGSLPRRGYGELNKENLALKESDEESGREDDGEVSDSGTLRRKSGGTVSTMTGTDVSGSIDEGTEYSESEDSYYDDEEVAGEGTEGRGVVMYEQPA
ncbi:hypothetical protein V495_03848 [Pseudogymnoascus sp. VKM F-4514 (FW-929)]|nr:hypothetical protein V495_03848 [Pseudogymnoascus sp. VKM F-4514 (FW-929)]KFY60510.1 hypothetical protein V497_03574 [Pseudogymnoascus sp. VKM F-4516 (FW-969)]